MIILKQNTVATVKAGPFVDDTDGVTVEDELTIANVDVKLSKNGGALAAANSVQGTGNAAYDDNGYYAINLNATDTNTLGNLRIAINYLGALPVWEDCLVVTEAAWNALVGITAADPLEVEVPGDYAQGTAGYALGQIASGDGSYTTTVEYPAGTPVVGAVVTAYTDEDCLTEPLQTVITNELGSFTLRLPLGDYYARIDHPDFVSEIIEVTVT